VVWKRPNKRKKVSEKWEPGDKGNTCEETQNSAHGDPEGTFKEAQLGEGREKGVLRRGGQAWEQMGIPKGRKRNDT